MHALVLVIGMCLAASIAMIIQNWLLRKVSVNYIALIIGIILALVLGAKVISFQPELFMGLIIAPLLFFEGQQNRLYSIARSWKSIVSITVIMILIATMFAAFSLKLTMGLSLSLSFILAAISTPTDATATESVTHGLKIPHVVEKYLKNESLFNDASGIILLNMAVSWYLSKHLQIGFTFVRFLYSAIGGIVFGLLASIVLVLIRQQLLRRNLKFVANNYDPTTAILLLYILTPILLYYAAEEIHVSGIIAVVVSGLIHNAETERSRLTNLNFIYNGFQTIRTLSDLLNCIVFVGLGASLVLVMQGKFLPSRIDLAIVIGLVLYIANVLVRFIYSYVVLKMGNRDSWIFALGGIHGAVTFALAYTLDATLISSSRFHLILFSEATLIILSMIIPTIIFHFILPKERSDEEKEMAIDKVKEDMVKYALTELNKIYLPKKIRKQLEFDLKAQINETSMKDFLHELKKSIKQPEATSDELEFRDEIYRYAFRLERNYLGQVAQQKQEYREGFLSLYREILLAEVLFLNSDNE